MPRPSRRARTARTDLGEGERQPMTMQTISIRLCRHEPLRTACMRAIRAPNAAGAVAVRLQRSDRPGVRA